MRFIDRADAGRRLAQRLEGYAQNQDVIVIALPRGGVAVGFEIAKALHVPLDVVVSRKIGAPGQPELAIGALTQEGEPLLNTLLMLKLGLSTDSVAPIVAQERKEVQRRVAIYRPDRGLLDLKDKIVLITDDGVATGATMRVALATVRSYKPAKIVLALPVCPPEELRELATLVDETLCLQSPQDFWGVGAFYDHFDQVSDEQVITLMRASTAW